MKVLIKRTYKDKVTTSTLQIFDGDKSIYTCVTLELPWLHNARQISCIPEGTYNTKKRKSPKYGDHFHLQDVPLRDLILIHHGNFTKDTLGCIIVGKQIKDIDGDGICDVTNSKKTMDELNKILPDEFMVVIF